MRKFIAAGILLLASPALAPAQSAGHPPRVQGYAFAVPGTGSVPGEGRVVEQVGFGGEAFLYKGIGLGLEAGYAHWGRYEQAWIASGNLSWHFARKSRRGKADPFVLLGFSGFFPATEYDRGIVGGDFGGGVNVWLSKHAALRLEAIDDVDPGEYFFRGEHYVAFRIGFTFR